MSSREALIESARDLLWERGYVGTSPRAILDRAGVGQGSMYHHFAGKAELAMAAIGRSGDDLLAAADGCLSRDGTAVDRLMAWLHRERDVLRGCPIGRLAQDADVVEDEQLRTPVHRALEGLQERLVEVLRNGQESGELDPDFAPRAVAATLLATLQGGYVLARAARSPEPFELAVDGAEQLIRARRSGA